MSSKRYCKLLRFQNASQYSLLVAAFLIFVVLVLAFLLPFLASLSPLLPTKTANGTAETASVAVETANGAAGNARAAQFAKLARLAKTALYTLKIAIVSTLIALVVGLPAAFFVGKRSFPGRKLLSSLSAVPLCTPPLLIALGFVMFFGTNGLLNRTLMTLFNLKNPPISFLYSFWGVVIAQGFYDFPIIMQTCASVWEKLPTDESDAARLLGASERRVFFTVTLRQLIPAIASSCALVFLYCFFSFIIVMLFGSAGGQTLEVEIYTASRVTLDFKTSSLLSLLETAIAIAAVIFWVKLEKHNSRSTGLEFSAENSWKKKLSTPLEKSTFAIFILIISLFLLLPLAGIAYRAFASNSFKTLFSRSSFYSSLKNTLIASFCSASLSVIAATFYSVFEKTVDPLHRHTIFRTIPLLPMAVSSVVLGYGFAILLPRGTPVILILAQSAITWPFAFKQISSQMDRISPETIEAARLLSPHKCDLIFRVLLPMSRKGIFSAFAFCFAIASGDATLPLVLAVPKFDTLALFTYRLAGAYRFPEACAAGTVLAVLTALVFALGNTRGTAKGALAKQTQEAGIAKGALATTAPATDIASGARYTQSEAGIASGARADTPSNRRQHK